MIDDKAGPPALSRRVAGGVAVLTDPALAGSGVRVLFSERTGGASSPPYASLNLATHVGDDPAAVDANRSRLLAAAGLAHAAGCLTTAEQVHGDAVAEVDARLAGAGRSAAGGPPPVEGADALMTACTGVPLMLLFADCVPVVLVAAGRRPAVAVVHAGWRGALAGLPGSAARSLAGLADCDPASLRAYVGPHVCAQRYEVSPEIASAFAERFPSSAAGGRLVDLGAAVASSLAEAGVAEERTATAGVCTADATDRFYSYRAEGVTGRHAALVALL